MTFEDPPEITPDHWIIVPRWEEFQHYKDRHPTWIKVYARLLHDPDFLGLSAASRGILMTIWLLYAAENGPVRVADLTRFGQRLTGYWQLVSLNRAGFIELSASRLLAAKKEKEKEKESPSPLTQKPNKDRWKVVRVCTVCGIEKTTRRLLEEHLENVHGQRYQEREDPSEHFAPENVHGQASR